MYIWLAGSGQASGPVGVYEGRVAGGNPRRRNFPREEGTADGDHHNNPTRDPNPRLCCLPECSIYTSLTWRLEGNRCADAETAEGSGPPRDGRLSLTTSEISMQ